MSAARSKMLVRSPKRVPTNTREGRQRARCRCPKSGTRRETLGRGSCCSVAAAAPRVVQLDQSGRRQARAQSAGFGRSPLVTLEVSVSTTERPCGVSLSSRPCCAYAGEGTAFDVDVLTRQLSRKAPVAPRLSVRGCRCVSDRRRGPRRPKASSAHQRAGSCRRSDTVPGGGRPCHVMGPRPCG
jgi:hypothetical protein